MKTFAQRVVELASSVPSGKVTTYGALARAAGGGGQAARSVTAILAKASSQHGVKIPFHRIVYSGGKVWIDESHRKERMKLYAKEGIKVDERGLLKDFRKILFEFK